MAALPSSADLSALMDQDVNAEQADSVLAIITAMARAYTRGRGFNYQGAPVVDEIRAAILTASARLLSNSKGLLYDESVGPESVSYRSAFSGWTLVERMSLDRWRVQAL